MKIEVDIKKKYFLFLITTILVLASIFGVYATWNTAKAVWHNADDVKVTLSENNLDVDYSLQELITGGRIEVAPLAGPGDVYSGVVNIISYDTSAPATCYAQIRINNQQYLPDGTCQGEVGADLKLGGIYLNPNEACGLDIVFNSDGSVVSDNCQNLFKQKYLDSTDLNNIKTFLNAKFSKTYTNIELTETDYNIRGTNSPLSTTYCAGGPTFCNDFFDATFKIRAS